MIPAAITTLLWRAAPYLVLALGIVTGIASIHYKGVKAERQRTEMAAAKDELDRTRAALADYEGRIQAVTKVAEQYREAGARTRTITKEIVREVRVLVPADACPLPPGFRVLHDAAAAGTAPDPAASAGADGGPVPAQEAAESVAENYGTYHDLAERHRALQRYVKEQLK